MERHLRNQGFLASGMLVPDRHKLNFMFFVNHNYVCAVNIANKLYMCELCV